MTALVGVYCKDGLVIAADSALTIRNLIEQSYSKKVAVDNDLKLISAFSGSVGFAQRYRSLITKIWKESQKELESIDLDDVVNQLSMRGIEEFYATHKETASLNIPTAFLLGFVHQGKHYLVEFPNGQFQPTLYDEDLWYCALGSGSDVITPFTGFLRKAFWEDGVPSVRDGIFAAYMCLKLALDINAGGVNGEIHIGVIERQKDGSYVARKLDDNEIQYHESNHDSALKYFSEYPKKFMDPNAAEIPKFPEKSASNKGSKVRMAPKKKGA